MNLSQFLAEPGKQAALARALNVPQPSLSQWKTGERPIPEERAPAIELATEGQVCVEELIPAAPWLRVVDKKWPHPKGRPVIDHAARNRAPEAVKEGA